MSSIIKKIFGNSGDSGASQAVEVQPLPGHQDKLAPGQFWGRRFVIYAANGVQHIKAEDWKLKVTGLVEKPLEFTYDEFNKLPMKSFVKSIHCVTKWSIENPTWDGVSIKLLAEMARVKPEATWVMFHCYDGYTAPIPIEDALNEDAIVALKMNGKPLLDEQGFPARPFMPQLYAWKSAKWLGEIEFIPHYEDGYWEMYGYHERGNIWVEERFKGDGDYKPIKRRAFGTV
jgi:DMSO/TMAO reductase YedYZ molybdopterin-dependent catalytic subunit